MIDVDGERPADLGDASLRDAAVDGHLAKPQVGVNEAERERRVVIRLRLDERDLVVVPVDTYPAMDG